MPIRILRISRVLTYYTPPYALNLILCLQFKYENHGQEAVPEPSHCGRGDER